MSYNHWPGQSPGQNYRPAPSNNGYYPQQQYQTSNTSPHTYTPISQPYNHISSSPTHPMVVIPPQPPPQHYNQQYHQYQQYVPRPQVQYRQMSQPKAQIERQRPQHATPVQQKPPPQRSTSTQTSSPIIRSDVKPQSKPNVGPQVVIQKQPQPDYQLLLLSLAEEYIAAAHSMAPAIALLQRQEEMDQYQELMATGLACMESVLKNFRQHPRSEGALRLRYASLLHEETENNLEAEIILSKGITLCERNRFFDLKYSMQNLLARVLFTTPKTALTSLDNLLPDVDQYGHVPWSYAFRFLRVTLSLQTGSRPDIVAAQQHLRVISNTANSRGDKAVFVTCAALEAMVHLRSAAPDSIEQAQRAIASARSLQLETSASELSQVFALIDLIDLTCSLQSSSPEQAAAKIQTMQTLMDNSDKEAVWKADGSFSIALNKTSGADLTTATGGIFSKGANGKDMLTFTWLPRSDLYILVYFLSGVSAYLRNCMEKKVVDYLQEGLRCLQIIYDKPKIATASIAQMTHRIKWQVLLEWHIRLHLTFALCHRGEWAAARSNLDILRNSLQSSVLEDPVSLVRLTLYLSGVIDQGTGNTDAALATYHSPALTLPEGPQRLSEHHQDICLLAALNSLFILRDPAHPQHYLSQILLVRLEPLCASHTNKSISSAFHLVRAVSNPTDPIIKKKQSLNIALHTAKTVGNTQLLAISMAFMTSMFFTNIVGEQAEKSASAARQLAIKGASGLWTAVADAMFADTLQRCGKVADAVFAREEMMRVGESLPPLLRERWFAAPGSGVKGNGM
ncbi:hypothetical protein M501DRAFT_996019 [Patellaria atrata CBS 101060]|uniref:Cohesin loading factor n=1 Tax=Patellaria atrata CBS 101060 TaxID=1346257 RepID=A0A9P4S8B3_9PEZI|nr:hypothetical protein M501DRAFT_996019 [Patellaria atrata CBS 101060]